MDLISLLISFLMAFGARASEEEHAPEAPAERAVSVLERDTKVPHVILEKLEADYAKELKKAAGDPKPKHALLSVALELTEHGEDVLLEHGTFALPPGGGALDLSGFVGRTRGGFNVALRPRDAAGSAVDPARVYFVSRAKARKLDGEVYGDGCGTFMDLTKEFRTRFAKRGFDVYTTEQRYLATLGGTFIFARFEQSSLQVASVTFSDSRYPQLLCE